MEDIISRIKAYVLDISSLVDNDLLDFYIDDTVNRALIYMNRVQLVDGYEEFLDGNYYYNNYTKALNGDYLPILPIPTELEKPLARTVVNAYNTAIAQVAKTKEVTSKSEEGLSTSYSGALAKYFNSVGDAELFADIKSMLDRYVLATVVR